MQFAVAQFSGVRGGSVPLGDGGEKRERPFAADPKKWKAAIRYALVIFDAQPRPCNTELARPEKQALVNRENPDFNRQLLS